MAKRERGKNDVDTIDCIKRGCARIVIGQCFSNSQFNQTKDLENSLLFPFCYPKAWAPKTLKNNDYIAILWTSSLNKNLFISKIYLVMIILQRSSLAEHELNLYHI